MLLEIAAKIDLVDPETDGKVTQTAVFEHDGPCDHGRFECAVQVDVRAQDAPGIVKHRQERQDDPDVREIDIDLPAEACGARLCDIEYLELGGDLTLPRQRYIDDAPAQVVAVQVEPEPGFAGRQLALGIVKADDGAARHPEIGPPAGAAIRSCIPVEVATNDLVELEPCVDESVEEVHGDRR